MNITVEYCAPGYSPGRYPMEGSSAGLYLIKHERFGGLEYRGFKENGEVAFHITEGQFFLRATGKCIRVLRFLAGAQVTNLSSGSSPKERLC